MKFISSGDTIEFDYENWKGKFGHRRATFGGIAFGSNEYHTEEQWLVKAFDLDKQAMRTFALKDMSNVVKVSNGN